MKFTKGDIIIPVEAVYPDGALTVDDYESDGTLLAHPLGGGFQYRLPPGAESKFRVVPSSEAEGALWRRSRFVIEGTDSVFQGWTDGRDWNGWAMPHFEFSEAQRVIESLTDFNGKYDVGRDCFVTRVADDEDEVWEAQSVTLLGGAQIKVYGIGAGSWIWEETERKA